MSRPARGMTLVEVLASLALLGSLLASLLMARAGLTRQWADNHQRTEALGLADRLMTDWWLDESPVLIEGGEGTDGPWHWRVSHSELDELEPLGFQTGRLEIRSDTQALYATIEWVAPMPSPSDEEGDAG